LRDAISKIEKWAHYRPDWDEGERKLGAVVAEWMGEADSPEGNDRKKGNAKKRILRFKKSKGKSEFFASPSRLAQNDKPD
jgi:hypothetical protein